MSQASVQPGRSWVVAGVAGVFLWRVTAFLLPSSLVSAPGGLRLPLALLGVLFLGCGVWAWWIRPSRATAIFLAYGIGNGIHWGGTVGPSNEGLELSLFFVYLGFTALADAALLHLALVFPSGRSLARGTRVALYVAAALALLVALIAGLLPQTSLETTAGLILLVANLLSLTAGVVFLASLLRVDSATRRAARLPLIVSGMVAGSVVALLGAGGALPGHPEAWNLALGVIPISLAIALVSHTLEQPAEIGAK